ncbi:MAG: TonB-dependent receptor domain-containing protein [Terriglobales bacterium]
MRLKTIAVVLFLSSILVAQEYRGSINGTITDVSGAAVAGVTVRVTNVATNTSVDTATDERGYFQAQFLSPGTYSITAESRGFKKTQRQAIRVDAGSNATANFVLQVGSDAETVNVTASAPLLETTNADLGQVVPDTYVKDVGVSIFRNAANYVRIAPGVTGQSTGTYTSDNQTGVSINGGGGALNVGTNGKGTQGGANEWILDGVPDSVPLSTGSVVVVPTQDDIEEMKVDTTMLDASFGHSTGGAVTIVTKSGTNSLHGTAYGIGRWKGLNANTWQNDRTGTPKSDVNYHQWGYFVGGPLYIPHVYNGKGKTFWSTSFETDDDLRDLSETTRVPTLAESRGDFSHTLSASGAPLKLYNPFSTVLTSSGTFSSRSQFMCVAGVPVVPNANGTQTGGTPCAIIPQQLINSTGAAVLATLLSESGGPNIAGAADRLGVQNWFADKTYRVAQRDLSARVDHTISDKQRLFARYSRLTRNQSPDTLIFGAQQYNGSGANIDTFLQFRQSFTINDTYAFSPNFLGSFSYGYVRRVNNDSYGSSGVPAPSSWNLPSILTTNQYIVGMPNFAISSADTGVSLGTRINLIANNGHAGFATFTKAAGSHTLKFGVDFRADQFNTASQPVQAAGQFNIGPAFTDSNPLSSSASQTSGSGVATLLLGLADSGSLTRTAPLALTNRYIAGYLQDTWRISRKLTVTAGLRYDVETPYTERHNNVAFGFDPNVALGINGIPLSASVPAFNANLHGGLVFAGVNGISRAEGNLDKNNFGPRVGFAYQLFSKTVVRGGFALFYSPMADILSFLGGVNTFSPNTPYTGTTNSSATPATSISNPFPNGIVPTQGSSLGALSLIGNSVEFLNQNRVSPYNEQLQFSIQQQLPSRVIIEVAYVGMTSVKELESFNLNDLPLPLNVSANTASVPNPFKSLFPSNTAYGSGSTIKATNLMVAFPQFTSVTEDGVNSGVSTYNALALRAEKRMSRGLSVIGNFTWSKLMHNNVTSLVNQSFYHYRSIGQFDVPKNFRLAVTYAPPFHSSRSGLLGGLLRQTLGGWEITNFLSMESGLPLSITGNNGRPIIAGDPRGHGPIDLRLGDVVVNGVPQNPYFNTSVFQQLPSQFYPGSISPTAPFISTLRAPGPCALNTSVLKNFPIREQVSVQLRFEVFNTTNHPFFNAPGTNSSSPGSFGVITGASNSRQAQVGVKILF